MAGDEGEVLHHDNWLPGEFLAASIAAGLLTICIALLLFG